MENASTTRQPPDVRRGVFDRLRITLSGGPSVIRVDYHRTQMRFTLGAVLALLVAVAIVACSRGIDSTPAPTIVSASADTPVPTLCANDLPDCADQDTPEPESAPTVRVTPTILVKPTATARAAGKTGRGDSTSVQSKPDDVKRNEKQSPATATPSPFPTMQATPAPTAHPTPTMAPVPTPTSTVEPIPTAAVEPTPTTAVQPTPTVLVEPTPTPTVRPSPTAAAEPSATPTMAVEPTPTATVEPTATAVTAGPAPPGEITWVDNPDCESVSKSPLSTIPVKLSWRDVEQIVSSEVAASSAQRSQGLMCRGDVPHGSGMLFLFDQPRDGGFWMFNTYVPLDILYIDRAGNVIWHDTMEPCVRQMSESDNAWRNRCGARTSRPDTTLGGYTAALELPAGWLAQVGIGPDLADEMIVTWQ